MTKKPLMLLVCLFGMVAGYAQKKDKAVAPPVPASLNDSVKPKKASPLADKTRSSKKADGLFTVYQDTANGTMQLYVKKSQLGKEFIYQSFSITGFSGS